MVEAVLRIFEYTPGLLHAKTIISDNDHAVTGSINMDYRSFFLQFENGVWICRAPMLAYIKRDKLETFAVSDEVSLNLLKRVRKPERLPQAYLCLIAPLFRINRPNRG